ncbi:MAG: hypothetical protein HY816_11375 [Candidatus Wallbacteria bacterium]|nr:hypothetical protein [Candidatus Wallbacteria bacterium]
MKAFSFTGREYNQATGQYYNRGRWRQSNEATFLTRDKLFADVLLGLGPYAYTRGRPLVANDPLGLNIWLMTRDPLQRQAMLNALYEICPSGFPFFDPDDPKLNFDSYRIRGDDVFSVENWLEPSSYGGCSTGAGCTILRELIYSSETFALIPHNPEDPVLAVRDKGTFSLQALQADGLFQSTTDYGGSSCPLVHVNMSSAAPLSEVLYHELGWHAMAYLQSGGRTSHPDTYPNIAGEANKAYLEKLVKFENSIPRVGKKISVTGDDVLAARKRQWDAFLGLMK